MHKLIFKHVCKKGLTNYNNIIATFNQLSGVILK